MEHLWSRFRGVFGLVLAGLLVFSSSASSLAAAVYIPATIAGEAHQDRLGALGTIALSADGTTVSVAGSQTEDVRVFSWDGSALSQQGATISDGEVGSRRAVDLDDAGDSLAVGEPYSDLAGTNRGTVRVYDFDGANWNVRGSPVNGVEITYFGDSAQDQFGKAVALSGDGESFVASGFGSSVCSGSGGSKGSMKVFEWSGGSWAQRGSTIEGESCSVQLANASNAKNRVQISDDGDVIAATTESNTRIYGWDSGSSDWVQLGSSIPHSGQISLSDDGARIAIGVDTGAGFVRVYEYASGSWTLVGAQIDGETSGDNFWAVALDSDGDTLVVGADEASPRGEVSVLDWDGSTWTERFADMQGSSSVGYVNFGSAVDVSEDGRITAASDYRYDTYRGIVRLNAVGPFSLAYDLNGGDGGLPAGQEGDFGTSLTVSASEPNRTGYTFEGWSTTANGSLDYASGASFSVPLSNTTLYARWQAQPGASPIESSSSGQATSTVPNASAQVEAPDPNEVRQNRQPTPIALKSPLSLPNGSRTESKAQALVGGRLVDLTISTSELGATVFDIGGVQLSFRPAAGDAIASNSLDPSIAITASKMMDFEVGGLEPGSTVQVFFPLENGSFLSLADLTANLGGAVSVQVDTSRLDGPLPIPIGAHKIQFVALNSEGEQIVIEVPLQVVQPDPQALVPTFGGDSQSLGAGDREVVVNGVPLESSSFNTDSGFGIRGEGWQILFESDSASDDVSGYQLSLSDGLMGTVGGFKPATRIDLWLYSTPVLLGSSEIGLDGFANLLVDLESISVPSGLHTLQVQGVNLQGYIQIANLAVDIADPPSDSRLLEADSDLLISGLSSWISALLISLSLIGLVTTAALVKRSRDAQNRSQL